MLFLLLQNIFIPSKMIQEPSFPDHFTHFITFILERQLQADHHKAQLDSSSAKYIFGLIDTVNSKQIYVEDFYTFLKKNFIPLNKKELKFVNKYFGFNSHEKLKIEEFNRYFINIKNPKNQRITKSDKPLECFLTYIKHIIQSYIRIQELRINLTNNLDELKNCLNKFYANKAQAISCQMIKEVLYLNRKYSRLNTSLVSNYIMGQGNKEIALKQLFWSQSSFLPKQQHALKKSRLIINQLQLKQEGQKKFSIQQQKTVKAQQKHQSSDILQQIQNIQGEIRRKKESYLQRKHILQQQISKPIGSLVKKNSYKSLNSSQTQNQTSKTLYPSRFITSKQNIADKFINNTGLVKNNKCQRSSFQSEITPQYTRKPFLNDDNQSKVDKVFEQQFMLGNKKINDLLKSRMSNKVRQQVLNKASSHAKLKIEEIERRVMSRVGQKSSQTNLYDEIPYRSSKLQSKNSSLYKY